MAGEPEQNNEEELLGIDFVFEMGLRKVEEQLETIRDIDSKMVILIGFIATFVALLVGFLLGAEKTRIEPLLVGLTPLFFYPFLIFLLLGLIRCFQAFQIRDYFAAFQYPPMVEWANEAPRKIKNAFVGGVLDAVRRNADEMARKRNYAKQGTWLILFAVVLLFLVLVSLTLGAGTKNENERSTLNKPTLETKS